MKKIDFDKVRERIEVEKKPYKPGEWAKLVGVSPSVVSNIHGATKQKPSIQYIACVSNATGKSVDYFLWGKEAAPKKPKAESGDNGPTENNGPISIEGARRKKHRSIVDRFKNPEQGLEINELLLEIEEIDPEGLKEIKGYLIGVLNTTKRLKKNSPTD